jgi:hypothetical protein
MAINSELMRKLLPLLRPLMENESQRRGYLIRAFGTDTPLLHSLVLNTPTNDFIPYLVNKLVNFGEISGKPALCILLEVIREDVGTDIKLRINELLQQVREELAQQTIQNSNPINQDSVNIQATFLPGLGKILVEDQNSDPISHDRRRNTQTTFLSELRKTLVEEKQVYDLSRNDIFGDFHFIGFKETKLQINLVAFVKADDLTETEIVNLRDRFFNMTQMIAYDFGIKPGPRMPNGLLGFVFENECPNYLINFIKKQSKIDNFRRSAVIFPWVIDVKQKQIHTHNNPVSLLPPVMIVEDWVFPGLQFLKSFVQSYRSQPVKRSISVASPQTVNKQITSEFSRLEARLEEIIRVIQAMSEKQSKYHFPNAQRVQIFEQVSTYIENNNVTESEANQILADLKKVIEDLQQQYPQASEEQATDIIDAEFKEIQRTQPKRWQNFLSLKRLWNGVKKGSLKAGEHFAEETPWGKAAIGFLEGITDEIE